MTCPRCQAEIPEGARFCEDCGFRLELACPTCGQPVGIGKKFCRSCGTALAGEPRQPIPPQSYTPRHLAEKILASKSSLEGERKQVTVLFADMKGSMELLADRDPEEARKILDPVLELMMEAVHRYEGTVNQVMGDGIMALFGAPLAHEDHAVRACYAALRMQHAAQHYAEEARRTTGAAVGVRVGLNSGEVVVRSIGSDLRMDYTAVGQTTHLAARMEQAALPGSIVIPTETLRLAEGFVQVKPLGRVPVKGLEAPTEVYEVTGAGPVRRRMDAAVARGLTRFVGRDTELDQLRKALEQVAQGHGQVVGVVGEPGVGKSRLFHEFTHSHRTHGWLILESGSVSYGGSTTYLPVIDLLKAYFQIETRDDEQRIREKVGGKLLALDQALMPTLPVFLELFDLPVEDAHWQSLDPPQRRQRTLDAVKRLLLRESQVQPLYLVFEDLHWIDSETQAVLDSLIESLPAARILALVNYRPEYEQRWGNKTYYRQLRLDPLPPETADELLQALLGTDDGAQALKPVLIERTEGNPFFLEQSVRTLVETHVLVGERGAYRLAKPVHAIQVPATVQAVLAARIDRLPPEEKRLLQSAAVIGKDVPYALLQAIAEEPEEALRSGLAHLQSAEFLYEASLFPELEYTFKHALTHEVAYRSLLQERRKVLHARIMEAIERLYSDRIAEQVERLAHHGLHGEVWGKAAAYLQQAGTKATARSAYREAAVCFESGLATLSHLPESRETLERGIDLRLGLRNALYVLAELEKGFACLREAEPLARRLDDPRRLGWVWVYMSIHLVVGGRAREGDTLAQSAHGVGQTLGDLSLQVAANFFRGFACLALEDYPRAEHFFQQVVEVLPDEMERERCGLPGFPAGLARGFLARALAERGAFAEGIACGEEGLRIGERLDHPWTMIVPCLFLGYLYGLKGDFDPASRLLERAIAVAREKNAMLLAPVASGVLAHAYALSGRVAEALALGQEAVKTMEQIGFRVFYALTVAQLGEACVCAGRLEEAVDHARRALAVAREGGERGHEAWALRLLGEIASHRDPPNVEAAEQHYRESLAIAAELGMRPLLAHCHLGLGTLYRRTGKHDQAREHLTTATTMYREMDMRFWLERAEAELRE